MKNKGIPRRQAGDPFVFFLDQATDVRNESLLYDFFPLGNRFFFRAAKRSRREGKKAELFRRLLGRIRKHNLGLLARWEAFSRIAPNPRYRNVSMFCTGGLGAVRVSRPNALF